MSVYGISTCTKSGKEIELTTVSPFAFVESIECNEGRLIEIINDMTYVREIVKHYPELVGVSICVMPALELHGYGFLPGNYTFLKVNWNINTGTLTIKTQSMLAQGYLTIYTTGERF